ncbi:hypothetical protein CAAN1_12S02278 [[Candida] anglica]|uniref:Uncharacterized protein n=1 Tax=[Candida] anglica TaxID=148631 RepID=A0ABP0E727_9ASCO
MSELYFLRHGKRIDHAQDDDPSAQPIEANYQPYDPSLAQVAIEQIHEVAEEITRSTRAFDGEPTARKNIFIHFSPYLRCCQTADILMTNLKENLTKMYPKFKIRFQLLGDFALSEWVHEKMKDKPPFSDSNDAYQMYTPNVKLMKNRSACSNFRPTNTLGPYNGPDLSYKEYKARCKDYFQKLIATYDKPANIRNKDIVIVVSHGYVINNFMSYFLNHPIFEEIPECKLNYALKIETEESQEKKKDDGKDDDDEKEPEYTWRLMKDALGMITKDGIVADLNLETDIVYYKTNFIKKDDLENADTTNAWTPTGFDNPQAHFDIDSGSTMQSKSAPSLPVAKPVRNVPVCAAAKDWSPESHQFKMATQFSLKTMNPEAFKQEYCITNHPLKPISPEVSPNSEPTRNNSVIDLSKLMENDEIYKPVKLRYSSASDIPIHKLNSKVNSQVNLAQAQRSNGSSTNSSIVDFSKFVNQLQSQQQQQSGQSGNRKRSTSNPIVSVVHDAPDSYFPSGVRVKNTSDSLDSSPNHSGSDLNMIKEQPGHTPQNEERPELVLNLNRASSLNYKKHASQHGSLSLLAKYQREHGEKSPYSEHSDSEQERDQEKSIGNRMFSLSFKNSALAKGSGNPAWNEAAIQSKQSQSSPSTPTLVTTTKQPTSTPKGIAMKPSNSRGMFYNLDSDNDSNSDSFSDSEDESKPPTQTNPVSRDYLWFGQNRE